MKVAFYRRRFTDGDGGASSFQSTVLTEIVRRSNLPFEPVIVSERGQPRLSSAHEELIFDPASAHPSRGARLMRLFRPTRPKREGAFDRLLTAHGIELVWFLGSFQSTCYPKVLTVFDLEHRSYPMFPELSRYGWTWAEREMFYRENLAGATFVICGTERGRDDVLRWYGVAPERARVLSLPVPEFAAVAGEIAAENTKLPVDLSNAGRYLFYPAQCWPHKNHITVLLALKSLDARGVTGFSAVFAGASKENRGYIEEQAHALGLAGRVIFTGFCREDEIRALYRGAFALVYPSVLGPDNLPPLEAFALGCPVVAADTRGCEEQLGKAALRFHPTSEDELADRICLLLREPERRRELVAAGRRLAASRSAEAYVDGISSLIAEVKPLFRCWDTRHPERYRW